MPAINFAAQRCLDSLRRLTVLPDDTPKKKETAATIRDALGRFKIWTDNICALQDVALPTSLEHRLRKTPKLKTLVLDVLGDLSDDLSRVESILNGESEERLELLDPVDPEGRPSLVSELEELGACIHESITELLKSSRTLRTSIRHDPYATALARVRSDEICPHAEDVELVGQRCRRLNDVKKHWLRNRLAEANQIRRKFLKYREDHQERLETGAVHKEPASEYAASGAGRSEWSGTQASSFLPMETFLKGRAQASDDDDETKSASLMTEATVYELDEDLRIPTLGEASGGEPTFPCPHCKVVQTIKDERTWRKHVFHDIKAYVCTHQCCELVMFEDSNAWLNHELSNHFAQWECPFCLEQPCWESETGFKAHMATEHPSLSNGVGLKFLCQTGIRVPEKLSATACPFCKWDEVRRSQTAHQYHCDETSVSIQEYKRHVGGHLRDVASIAVACTDEVKDTIGQEDDVPRSQCDVDSLDDRAPSEGYAMACNDSDPGETSQEQPIATFESDILHVDDPESGYSAVLMPPPKLESQETSALNTDLVPVANATIESNWGLKRIKHSDAAVVDIIIVAIPWLMKANQFAICADARGIPLSNANIFSFEVLATVDDSFAWDDLLEYGNMLVEILDKHRASQGNALRPIIFMAHSLAGFIVKQCINIAHAQSGRYALLKDAFHGVLLMGCPHVATENRRDVLYERSRAILSLSRVNASRSPHQLETGRGLLQICKQFDKICGSLNVKVFYEVRSTKVPGVLRPSAQYLVDKLLSKTKDISLEASVIGIHTDHIRLPLLTNETLPGNLDKDAIHAVNELLKPLQDAPKLGTDNRAMQPFVEDFVGLKIPPFPAFMVDTSRRRNRLFTGREDVLIQLAQKLVGSPSVVVLQGPGGLGKSECALQFAHENKSNFDAIFWVQADTVSKIRQAFGDFAAPLGLEDATHLNDAFTNCGLVKSWLKQPFKTSSSGGNVKAKWLMIFDGADDPVVLHELDSIQGHGSILVTSRDPKTVEVFSGAAYSETSTTVPSSTLELRPFQIEEAASVFRRLAQVPDHEDEDKARQIVQLLDGWPLAISQMAGVVRSQQLSLAQFLEKYDEFAVPGLQAPNANASPDTARETMVSSMQMAKLSQQAAALLQVLAMLNPDCIQKELFSTMPSKVPLDGFPTNSNEFEKALKELLSSSIVEINDLNKELWTHRVIQDTVRGQCSKTEYDCSFQTAALLVKRAYNPPDTAAHDNLKLWEPRAALLRHVLHLQQCYELQTAIDVGPLKNIKPSFEFAWLLSENATFQRCLGNTPGLKRTLILALSICDELPGLLKKDAFDLRSEIYHSLGAWANETNHPAECVEFNGRYLEMAESALLEGATPTQRTAMAYNQYGTGQMMIREYATAMKAFQKSIDLYKSLPTATPSADSLAKVNLATAKWSIGDLEGADALLQSGLLAREEAFGVMDEESFRTGRFYHTLGNVRWSQNRPEESEIWHRRALKQYLSVLGPMHHRTSDVRHKVAEHCLRNEDFDNAGKLIEQALTSWELDAQSFKPEIARTTWLKSRQKGRSGNAEEARESGEEAYRMRQQLVPDDTRPCEELTDEDFDDLVTFWSR